MTRTALRIALSCVTVAALAGTAPQAAARKPAGLAFANHHLGGGYDNGAEPSIGANWRTGAVMYQAGTRTYAISFGGKGAKWAERTYVLEGLTTLDPILYTEPRSGRTFVSQLTAGCSLLSYTDDDGKTWTPTQGCGPGAYVDHQTVGAGPFAPGPLGALTEAQPGAVYYCAQAFVTASCARSDTGGLTFGPAVPMYHVTQCGGLHGHLRVSPDGTVYVPHMGCGNEQAVVVSEDNGATWSVRKVPGSEVSGESDPSVASGSDNTTYFGYQHGRGHDNTRAMVAVTRDRGRTWSKPVDVSSRLGIKNVQFPQIIAGDGDRAALAFLGTKTGGNDQLDTFEGEWRLYVALTYDRGRTWTTVNATPNELVQRGCIELTGCTHRNLLDFNDITVDKQGRVLVAWADGCPRVCETGDAAWSSRWRYPVVTRQAGGKGLFKAYDGKL